GADSTATGRASRVFTPVLEQLRATPGVIAAGVTTHIPLQRWGTNGTFWIVGHPKPTPGQEPYAEFRTISPGYLAALGIPLRRGRDFNDGDHSTANEPVIVNEAFARRELPGIDPIGQRSAPEKSAFAWPWARSGARSSGWCSAMAPSVPRSAFPSAWSRR